VYLCSFFLFLYITSKQQSPIINQTSFMAGKDFHPYVPAETSLKELTIKALVIGVALASVMGAANAYIGLKAGMTISATFPAAVLAIALLRGFKGTILEENMVRTTASVGEALVAGAIFTLPAFIITGIWTSFNYWESTMIMLAGGILGVLFVVLLRRVLIDESDLPYPESIACAEIVKAGQKGESGAKYVFGSMGFAAVIEFFKNSRGIKIFGENFSGFIPFKDSIISIGGKGSTYSGGLYLQSPLASPALVSVGYIIGFELSSIAWAGGLFAWFFLIPLGVFLNGRLPADADIATVFTDVWQNQVRMIAIGAMLVGAVHTLWGLRKPLLEGLKRAFRDLRNIRGGAATGGSRLQKDIPFAWILICLGILVVPITAIYFYYTQDLTAAVCVAVIMIVTGFLFTAVAGYLVGVMGGSNNPISGLTLPSLVIAALLMVLFGIVGKGGIAAALGVAAVVCCALGIGGSILQDLKVGHLLGGTPWKMELGEIVSVIVTSFVLVFPMAILHAGTPGGIGGAQLPAPQAGLMAALAKGIVGGTMAWPLLLFGAAFAVGLILIKSPSPTLIAVGMYLPFETTSAIFVGGLLKYLFDAYRKSQKYTPPELETSENKGILLASGLVAGEAITGVILAGLYLLNFSLPSIADSPALGLLIFGTLAYILIVLPLRKANAR
jgi:putative OPT family oligopeptide transporter